jgi:hypothetical protein
VNRLLQTVEVADSEAVLSTWEQQVRAAWQPSAARWLDGIAIDGKTLRGARRLGVADTHPLSACCQRLGLVLADVAVPEATNEVGAVGPLLERLLLSNETVTFDAAFTQYAVASQVVHQGGAYFLVLKGNQPTLLREAQHATSWPARYLGRAHAVHLAHGRLEGRTLVAASAQDLGWPHARQVLRLHRRGAARGDRL